MISTRVPAGGRTRPVVSGVTPSVDGGKVPVKRVVGDVLVVEADVFLDGHDLVAAVARWRHADDPAWSSAPMAALGNDRYRGHVPLGRLGCYELSIVASVDRFGTWCRDLSAKLTAGTATPVDLAVGAALLDQVTRRAAGAARQVLAEATRTLQRHAGGASSLTEAAARVAAGVIADPAVRAAADSHPEQRAAATATAGTVWVDPPLAGSSAWYELFPRSASPDPGRAGTLQDVIDRLPYVARLGFDVLYLPPIHPIGTTARKGPNGATVAGPADPGSPWAIGSPAGGHTAVDPGLGTIADVDRLVEAAAGYGIAVALDLAWQCSPDHPWVSEHPDWFRRLPDGSIACAENPPKRYEDVYPLDFETEDWRSLWAALADVVRFWTGHGIRVFRVDNPHTKPMRMWAWLLAEIRTEHPDVVFLSEAFTRPRVMQHLAKVGFSQSYTYFTWRTAKWEIEEYLRELTSAPLVDYFRPNFWPNTPDILPEHLQEGRRAAFISRLVLAATGAASYGIYGPVFELQQHLPRHPGSEEYLDSEKYQVRHWDLDDPASLAGTIALVNAARRAHPALRQDRTLRLVPVDNDQLVAYVKSAPTGSPGDTPTAQPGAGAGSAIDVVLTVVSLDTEHVQSGWVEVPLHELGLPEDGPFEADDLLTGARFEWSGERNFIALDPGTVPAHVLHLHARSAR